MSPVPGYVGALTVITRLNGDSRKRWQRVERPDWAPRDVDIDKASAARLYDYFLGGSYNFEVDRELGRQYQLITRDDRLDGEQSAVVAVGGPKWAGEARFQSRHRCRWSALYGIAGKLHIGKLQLRIVLADAHCADGGGPAAD